MMNSLLESRLALGQPAQDDSSKVHNYSLIFSLPSLAEAGPADATWLFTGWARATKREDIMKNHCGCTNGDQPVQTPALHFLSKLQGQQLNEAWSTAH